MRGFVNVAVLQRVLSEIVRRHETLRTTFRLVDGKPVQIIALPSEMPLEQLDLRVGYGGARPDDIQRYIFEESRRPFDLGKGPLFRASLVKLSAQDHILMLVMHHIIADGWSMSVLNHELQTLYLAFLQGKPSPLAELPIQYAQFAAWQADWFQGNLLQQQLGYWQKQLSGLRPVIDLPTDRPRPEMPTNRGAVLGFTLDHPICEGLKRLSQEHRATLFMTLLAAFKALLNRLSGDTDIAVGAPIANRMRSELEGLIGFFVNTLVLRTDLSGDPTFLDLLEREREVALEAYSNQDMPFEKLVEELQPDRDLSHNPFFQILFAVQNVGVVDQNAAPINPSRPDSKTGTFGNGTAKFDLTMSFLDTGAGAQGFLEYNSDLFDAKSAQLIIERYLTLLRGVLDDPEMRLSDFPIEADILEATSDLPVAPRDAPDAQSFVELLDRHATKAGDSPAVVTAESGLSYAELSERANRMAQALLAMNLGSRRMVALITDDPVDRLVATVAVMKAGLVAAPVDSGEFIAADGQPLAPQRRDGLLSTFDRGLVILDDDLRKLVGTDRPHISLGALRSQATGGQGDLPLPYIHADQPALAVADYSEDSGFEWISLSQKDLCALALDPALRLTPEDRVLCISRPGSDRAIYEVFGALAGGATAVLAPAMPKLTYRKLANLLRDRGVTVAFLDMADLERISREFPRALRSLRLILSDERGLSLIRLRDRIAATLLGRVCLVTGHPAAGGYYLVQPLADLPEDAAELPLGRPVAGARIALLDARGRIVPERVPGRLCVEALPEKPELNYATPDVARWEYGRLVPHGAVREVLLVFGTRVWPAEIEAALREHPGVAEAAVVRRQRNASRERGLVAFIEPEPDAEPSAEAVLSDLAARLPVRQMPETIQIVAGLPRTDKDAVDRRAVADLALEFDNPKWHVPPYMAPRNDVETGLAQIWMEVLGADRIGVHDNFFQLGGHSLIATQVAARIGDTFRIELPLQRMFDAPTIELLARVIEPLVGLESHAEMAAIKVAPRDRMLPLSFAQQRLWFLDQLEPDSAFYNIALPVRFNIAIVLTPLHAALFDLAARHEILRTRYATVDGEPRQIIEPELRMDLPVHDLRRLVVAERRAEVQRLTTLEAQQPFDLERGPVIRARLVQLSDSESLLLLTVHHIAADGWSMEILLRELMAFYEVRRGGRHADLPTLPIQYADFACWQRRWLSGTVLQRQVDFWKQRMAGAPSLLELPTDRPRPAMQAFSGEMHMFVISPEMLAAVKRLAEQAGVTLFTILISAFYALVHRYTGRDDLVVGTPIANRVRPELEGLIGFFANTVVLRVRVPREATFFDLIEQVRESTVAAYAHQDIPFEKLVEELQPERNLSYNPLFQLMFALQNTSRPTQPSVTSDEETPTFGAGVAKFDMTMFLQETANDLRAGIEYNSDLFDPETIARVADHYRALLRALTEEPESPIWSAPMISPSEVVALADWNDTKAPVGELYPHQLFEKCAAERFDAEALVWEDEVVTYGELNRRANVWAEKLIAEGVRPGAAVAIYMHRSVHLIVAILATLKAGAAYVPLDPSYPAARLSFMASDSGATLVLTQPGIADDLTQVAERVLVMEDGNCPAEAPANPNGAIPRDRLGYIIYTSGSSGRPKGVAMPLGPLASLVQWQIARSDLPPGAPTLQFSSPSFDVSFQEIMSTLGAGGKLVLMSEATRREPQEVLRLMRRAGVRRLFLPYVGLQQLAEYARGAAEVPEALTDVITAGEQLQITPQIAEFFSRTGAKLFHQYGPTESHVVTEFELAGSCETWPATPPIGRAIPNATVHVLDPHGQVCPVGVPGELYLGGALAQGYLNRPDLTAERFVPDVNCTTGTRLYRTGDRGRVLRSGDIQFLGRVDDQVKIRGFRIEPGEIEAALRTHPIVREAIVVPRAHNGEVYLAGYVQVDTKSGLTPQELRGHLATTLPDHMIPAVLEFVETLVQTPSGKLDRMNLPAPRPTEVLARADGASHSPIETDLLRIWRDLLQVPEIGTRDNFFEFGGHSLLATRVISRIRDEYGVDLPLRCIFETPTVEALSMAVLDAALAAQDDDDLAGLLEELEDMSDDAAHDLATRAAARRRQAEISEGQG